MHNSYIIGLEQPDNKILFQGRNAQLVDNSKDALPFVNPPVIFVKNMRENGLQPVVFKGLNSDEPTIVEI